MHFGSAMRILCDFCQQVHAVEEGARREESLMKSKVDIKSARGRQSSYVGAADAGSASTDLWIIISGLKASAWIFTNQFVFRQKVRRVSMLMDRQFLEFYFSKKMNLLRLNYSMFLILFGFGNDIIIFMATKMPQKVFPEIPLCILLLLLLKVFLNAGILKRFF